MNSLDRTDRAILGIVQCDGRITVTDLARKVHLSQPAAAARLRKLEQEGVITGYAAKVSPEHLGLTTHVVIRLRTTHSQIAASLKQFEQIPEINRIYRITGDDCFLLDAHTRTPERLEEIIDAIGRFGPVSTSLVLREYPAGPLV
nr:Lrp/AsnC family transcriptional regulator [Rhodococcus sp. (in: high G+C Gram-positive bacteria)]